MLSWFHVAKIKHYFESSKHFEEKMKTFLEVENNGYFSCVCPGKLYIMVYMVS